DQRPDEVDRRGVGGGLGRHGIDFRCGDCRLRHQRDRRRQQTDRECCTPHEPLHSSPPARQVRVDPRKQKSPAFIDRNAGALAANYGALATLPETFDHVPQHLWERAIISIIEGRETTSRTRHYWADAWLAVAEDVKPNEPRISRPNQPVKRSLQKMQNRKLICAVIPV